MLGGAQGGAAVPPPRAGLTVILEGADGAYGEGVAAPLGPGADTELATAERVLGAVAARLGAPCTAEHLAEVTRVCAGPAPEGGPLAALRATLAPLADLLRASAVARFALETAAARLLAERGGRSMAEVLRGAPPRAAVAVNALVSVADGDLVDTARALVAAGFAALKVKVGRAEWSAELAALRALRRTLPPRCELRLDANGSWTLAEARERLAALTALDIAFVEQPVAPALLLELGACGAPWAADEALAEAGMAEALLDEPACVAFVLKPARLGLLDSLELARRAAARGKGVVVTHLFDGPSALAAACELALALEAEPLACGLMPWDAATRAVPHLRRAGICAAPPFSAAAGPGRGAEP
jgi:L-alanine-DL-glutamate epimerase-like enolase superfamily enzyme